MMHTGMMEEVSLVNVCDLTVRYYHVITRDVLL